MLYIVIGAVIFYAAALLAQGNGSMQATAVGQLIIISGYILGFGLIVAGIISLF